MKRYREFLIMVGLALTLYVGFSDHTTPADNDTPLATWVLQNGPLVGDTVITVNYDPFYKRAMTYEAYPLGPNLRQALGDITKAEGIQVIFECADGYRPHMTLEQVLAGNGFLAHRPEGMSWPDSVAEKMAPFYLVWPEAAQGDKSYVTPYGLTQIHLEPKAEVFGPAMPIEEAHLEGYELFSNTCMRCHSVNKVGGTLAPEFNYPRNITEYWAKENIWRFIQEPTAFRYNSQMPSMKAMIDRDKFEKIYAYLVAMKEKPLKE